MNKIKVLSGIIAVTLPVGYIIKKHVDWERTPQSKKRMLTHQLTFWAALGLGLVSLHQSFRLKRTLQGRSWKLRMRLLTAALLPCLGFEGGEKLSLKLFPHLPPPQKLPSANFPKHYRPSYMNSLEP